LEAVPRRNVKFIVVSFRPSDLQRPTLSIDQKPLTLLLGGPIASVVAVTFEGSSIVSA
jgi:hypothetical protein